GSRSFFSASRFPQSYRTLFLAAEPAPQSEPILILRQVASPEGGRMPRPPLWASPGGTPGRRAVGRLTNRFPKWRAAVGHLGGVRELSIQEGSGRAGVRCLMPARRNDAHESRGNGWW